MMEQLTSGKEQREYRPSKLRTALQTILILALAACAKGSAQTEIAGTKDNLEKVKATHTLEADLPTTTSTSSATATSTKEFENEQLTDSICAAVSLLENPGWELATDKEAVEAYEEMQPAEIEMLKQMDRMNVTVNFHGHTFLTGERSRDASALIFDKNGGWYTAMLATKEFNGFDEEKTEGVPLSAFVGVGNTKDKPFEWWNGVGNTIHTRFWLNKPYEITISQIVAFDSKDPDCAELSAQADFVLPEGEMVRPVETPRPIQTPIHVLPTDTNTSTVPNEWETFGGDTMKGTKDMVKSPLTEKQIKSQINLAIDAGMNLITVDVPYDSPNGYSSPNYARLWIDTIRSVAEERGVEVKVGHRRMFSAMEGIYDYTDKVQQRMKGEEMPENLKEIATKINTVPIERLDQYLVGMYDYIVSHPDEYEIDDVFYLPPELDVRGIYNVHGCEQEDCMFKSADDFNQWNVDAVAIAKEAFAEIGLAGLIEIQSGGLTGTTVAWLNNPDHEGTTVLDCETIEAFGGKVVIDHYAEDPKDMEEDLKIAIETLRRSCTKEFEELVIGEFGGKTKEEIMILLQAIHANGINEANYWPLYDGDTGLIAKDGTTTERYEAVMDYNSR